MALGGQSYAEDDSQKALTGVTSYADDDLNWLYPAYIPNLKSFICPATKNTIRDSLRNPVTGAGPATTIVDGVPQSYQERLHDNAFYYSDLLDNSPTGREGTTGHSYEIAGFFRGQAGTSTGGGTINVRKTQTSALNYYYKETLNLPRYNFVGTKASHTDVWIIYDADDPGGPGRDNQDYPDPGDNHGKDGGNVAFGDGHAEWVVQRKYIGSFIRGTDEKHALAATH
jgi:prepilin-type processing-associated H-X9-DG protein